MKNAFVIFLEYLSFDNNLLMKVTILLLLYCHFHFANMLVLSFLVGFVKCTAVIKGV